MRYPGRFTPLCSVRLLAVHTLLLSFSALFGEVPPVQPTFPNVGGHTPGQLLWSRVSTDNETIGRTTNIAYHNGIIYTNNVSGSIRFVWEWSNPGDITSLDNSDGSALPSFNDQGNHAHTKVSEAGFAGVDWLAGQFGARIRRSGVNENENSDQNIPGYPGNIQATRKVHRLYYPWLVPFTWLGYGEPDDASFFGFGTTPIAGPNLDHPEDSSLNARVFWDPFGSEGIVGPSILLGNLLFIVSDETENGIAAYDVSPALDPDNPQPPRLLDRLGGNLGAYIAVPWENFLVLARRDPRTVDIVDISDPTNLTHVKTIDVFGETNADGQPIKNGNSNVPYTQAQDNYIFTARHKIDMTSFEPVLELDEVGDNRPAGSTLTPLGTSQYLLPLGPYLVSGSHSSESGAGIGIWAHQSGPDNKAPYVGYHIPRPGQTNYPTQAPISLLIHETLESFTIINGETLILREVGTGDPIACILSFSHDDVLTITPVDPLEKNKTYEVVVVEGGIKDAAGNGIEGYSFTFSTGAGINSDNRAPEINAFTANRDEPVPGNAVTFTVDASDPDGDNLQYRYSWGDGTPGTDWIASSSRSHTFNREGHFLVKVQVRDLKPDGTRTINTKSINISVVKPIPGLRPTHSSSLAFRPGANSLWAVHPDNDALRQIQATKGWLQNSVNLANQIPGVDRFEPRSATLDAENQLWVAHRAADLITVHQASNGNLIREIPLGYGAAPVAIVASPIGDTVFATLEGRGGDDPGNGQLLRFDAATRAETGRLELGPTPRAIAVSADGDRVLVTRFLSPENFGVIWDIDASGPSLTLSDTIRLSRDLGPDGGSSGRGVPNQIAAIAISPDGKFAWYAATKTNTEKGGFFDQNDQLAPGESPPAAASGLMNPENTVRALVGRIDLATNQEPNSQSTAGRSLRIDIDNAAAPSAIDFSPRGDWAFVTLQGNNQLAVFDRLEMIEVPDSPGAKVNKARIEVGLAPDGIAVNPDGNQLFVRNFLSRSVTQVDADGFLRLGSRDLPTKSIDSLPLAERLTPEVLQGKRIFNNASDRDPNADFIRNRMSLDDYISCASCHDSGGQDGRVWDFTQRGEGLRNTIDLRGRAGTGQGNVHWTANFDEIHDFILDIMNEFGGFGFLPEGEEPHPSLGSSNAGRDPDLDALAAYVESLDTATIPASPPRLSPGHKSSPARTAPPATTQAPITPTALAATGSRPSTMSAPCAPHPAAAWAAICPVSTPPPSSVSGTPPPTFTTARPPHSTRSSPLPEGPFTSSKTRPCRGRASLKAAMETVPCAALTAVMLNSEA